MGGAILNELKWKSKTSWGACDISLLDKFQRVMCLKRTQRNLNERIRSISGVSDSDS
jgi:hypothetical protein